MTTEPRSRPPAKPAPTMRDFVTDGSIAGLCDRLTRLTGVPIWLSDASGDVIVPADGERPWRLVPAAEGIARAFSLVGAAPPEGPVACEDLHRAEMRISTGPLGAIEASFSCRQDAGGSGAAGRGPGPLDEKTIRDAVTLLASSVCDVGEAQVALRQRVGELDALYRLSSLLAQSADLDALLRDGIVLAVATTGARGGAIVLTDRPERVGVQANLEESEAGALLEALGEGLEGVTPRRMAGGALVTFAPLLFHGRAFGAMAVVGHAAPLDGAATELLESFAEHIAGAVSDARLRELREDHERVQRQVRLAADVQQRMLPRQTPEAPGLDIAARYTPSFELGGDFYDFIDLGGHLGVAVGDVVGKGVAAALLMSAVRASLRAHAEDVYDLRDVLARVNRALAGDTRDHEFATLFYGVFDPASLRLTHVSAGHEPALLLRPGSAGHAPEIRELHSGGMVLGIDPSQTYEPGIMHLQRGDALLLYTDGLTEAADFEGEQFGRGRLREILGQLLIDEPEAGAGRMIEHIVWHLRQFAGLSTRTDDVTIVAIRVTG